MATLTNMSITEGSAPEVAEAPGWTADDSTFGARLALIRQRMGWGNIARAAKECGVPTDSWRNWEVDGREPHRLTTIAMAIATKTGCDYLWLVHGPNRGARVPTGRYGQMRVLRRRSGAVQPTHLGSFGQLRASSHSSRAVQQTRPIIGGSPRPLSAAVL
jgi:hypothetical protein